MPDSASRMGDVDSIRRLKRVARKEIGGAEQVEHAERVAERALTIGPLAAADNVAAYLAMTGELDPAPTLARLAATTYMPVIGPDFSMEFRLFAPQYPLVRNSFGTDEPPNSAPAVAADSLAVVIVPLVAFDNRGFRIGMGAGYYDRAFEFTKNCSDRASCPLLIGVAHSVQQVALVPEQPWDVQLDFVVTEERLHGPFEKDSAK